MRDRFLALWRTGAQALFAFLLTLFVRHGIHIPASYTGAAEAAVFSAGIGVFAALTHWLQSQTGTQWYAKPAQFLGRFLVLGAGSLPTYAPPAQPAVPAPPAAGK